MRSDNVAVELCLFGGRFSVHRATGMHKKDQFCVLFFVFMFVAFSFNLSIALLSRTAKRLSAILAFKLAAVDIVSIAS